MKLTKKLEWMILVTVILVTLSLCIGTLFTLLRMDAHMKAGRVNMIAVVFNLQIKKEDAKERFPIGLPNLLQGVGVAQLTLFEGDQVRYRYINPDPRGDLDGTDVVVLKPSSYRLKLQLVHPLNHLLNQPAIWVAMLFSLFLVGFATASMIRWLRTYMRSAERLNRRAMAILDGVDLPVQGDEWPSAVSQAMDKLQLALIDANKERSRFDHFLRRNASIDPATGLANRALFDNRLECAIFDNSMGSGALILIELGALESQPESEISTLFLQVAEVLSVQSRKYEGALLARYSQQVFALLLPYAMSASESLIVAEQLHKSLRRLHLTSGSLEESFYLGVVTYQGHELLHEIEQEAELALRGARLRGESGCYLLEKGSDQPLNKGTVYWRTLISRHLETHNLTLMTQPAIQRSNGMPIQESLTALLKNEHQELMYPPQFMPMVEKAGLLRPFEYRVCELALALIHDNPMSSPPVSCALQGRNLGDQLFFEQLELLLLEYTYVERQQLIIELSEAQLVDNFEILKPRLKQLHHLGCRLSVNQVGQEVINNVYLKELEIDFLKLHPSLIYQIDVRPLNQMAVRSLIGSCLNMPIQLIAVGVSTENEWDMLQRLGIQVGMGRWFADPSPIAPPTELSHSSILD